MFVEDDVVGNLSKLLGKTKKHYLKNCQPLDKNAKDYLKVLLCVKRQGRTRMLRVRSAGGESATTNADNRFY